LKNKKDKTINKKENKEKDIYEEKIDPIINEKIAALDAEVHKFKAENEKVKRLRKQFEEENKCLTKNRAEFEKYKSEQMEKVTKHIEEENRKILKQKKMLGDHTRKINALNKKEKEEYEYLKQEITKIKEEMRTKDTKSKLLNDRLRKQ